ncbi:MAG: glycosyltransferase [Candidatus Moraniibacteriota bacterium]|nr:MAG: glycosyltransferase [Candidatus Moranbacteria bacterium]
MKIALVHDYLVQYGGAERVLESFCELFPNAPIYTLVYDEDATHKRFQDRVIKTSFLQKAPFIKKQHRLFPLLMPIAMEQFDFSRYDVVLSDSSSFAKGIITHADTLHICYMHTPMRYAWDDCQRYTREFHQLKFIKSLVPYFVNGLRMWDRVSSKRPDKIIANSDFVARRIQKYYRRNSQVIHPPVEIDSFYTKKDKGYFLMVGRLISYKRHDIVIDAFNTLGLPLRIIGQGPEEARLKKQARNNITFLGHVDDKELASQYASSRAFIFPQEEDFGIVAIEALASGKPILAFQGGDIVEHITHGKEGLFFTEQTAKGVIDVVKQFEKHQFNAKEIQAVAKKFDKKLFQEKIRTYIENSFKEFMEKKKNYINNNT